MASLHALKQSKSGMNEFQKDFNKEVFEVILNHEFGQGFKIDAASNSLVFEDLSLAVSLLDK